MHVHWTLLFYITGSYSPLNRRHWPAGIKHVWHEGDRVNTSRCVHQIYHHTRKGRCLGKKTLMLNSNFTVRDVFMYIITVLKQQHTRASVMMVPDADQVNTSICPGVSIKTYLQTKLWCMRSALIHTHIIYHIKKTQSTDLLMTTLFILNKLHDLQRR